MDVAPALAITAPAVATMKPRLLMCMAFLIKPLATSVQILAEHQAVTIGRADAEFTHAPRLVRQQLGERPAARYSSNGEAASSTVT